MGNVLGLIPKTDSEHQQLIGRAMFIAANVEVFGAAIAGILGLLVIVYFLRRRRKA